MRAHSGRTTTAKSSPKRRPPPPERTKPRPASHAENVPATTAATATLNQALAAHHRADAFRYPEAPEHRLRRDRIGGREDRAEDEGRAPRQARGEVRDDGH